MSHTKVLGEHKAAASTLPASPPGEQQVQGARAAPPKHTTGAEHYTAFCIIYTTFCIIPLEKPHVCTHKQPAATNCSTPVKNHSQALSCAITPDPDAMKTF